MSNSTRKRRRRHHQSAKPYDGFPLTAHPTGRWCKKVRGRIIFFGPIVPDDDGKSAQAALDKWLEQKDELLAGRVPREKQPQGATLRDASNAFLRHKRAMVESGEISPRTLADGYHTCAGIMKHFGEHRLLDDIRQEDFAAYRVALAKRGLGPVSLGNEIQRIRSLFKFTFESGMLKTPILFGPGFKRPSKKVLRIERAKKGPRMFEPDELRKLIDAAGVPLKAMILLACNGGLGNSDLSSLPMSVVNLTTGWCDYARVKTGIERRFKLWPETIEAIRNVIEARPTPKNAADNDILFVTKYGGRWTRFSFEKRITENPQEQEDAPPKFRSNCADAIRTEFNKLFAQAGINRRPGLTFYSLRHVFQTIGDRSRDPVAVSAIMGHADNSMSAAYRETIDDDRLIAVTDCVRKWLFGDKPDRNCDERDVIPMTAAV
jgi:integrase